VLPGDGSDAHDAQIEAIDDGPAAPNAIVARDEVRGLALVRVPSRTVPTLSVQPQSEPLELPGFLVIMDAAPGGPAVHAEFVSRVSARTHPAWDSAVLVLGGVTNAPPGAVVFTLSGRLVGIVLPDHDETMLAPGDTVIARATRMTQGESVLAANAGLAVQPLSPALARATTATNGVVIAAITGAVLQTPNGLRVGDVIAAIDNVPIRSVGDWERALSFRAPGTTVMLQIVRRDEKPQVPLTLTWRNAPLAPGDTGAAAAAARAKRSDAAANALGLTLRAVAGGSVEVERVEPGSAAARAGLQSGDRLTALPNATGAATAAAASPAAAQAATKSTAAPSPITIARVQTAFESLSKGNALMLAIDRAGQPLVVAIEKP
jgi:S1-C subfamily serine protease